MEPENQGDSIAQRCRETYWTWLEFPREKLVGWIRGPPENRGD